MHGYKWPINCTRTRRAGLCEEVRGGDGDHADLEARYLQGHARAAEGAAAVRPAGNGITMRVGLIGHLKPCMTDIYIHI